jgi:hypothetical protein
MSNPSDNSVRRQLDGSIDIKHYVAVAQHTRAEVAWALRNTVRCALEDLALRLMRRRIPTLNLGQRPLGLRPRA